MRIRATLRYQGGKAAAGKIIRFALIGPAGPKLSMHQARTNPSGVAAITIVNVGTAPFIVNAIASPAVAALELNKPA